MKKRVLGVLASVMIAGACFSQNKFPSTGSAAICTTTPNTSAALEIKSTTKGLLISRMTLAQRNAIPSPAKGLLIYQISNETGFYYYDGIKWKPLTGVNGANITLNNLTSPTAINASLLPGTNNAFNLGSSGFKWDAAYINQIHFGDGTVQSTASIGISGSAGEI